MNSKLNAQKVIKVNSTAERKLWQTAGRLQNMLGRKVSLCETIEFLFYVYEKREISEKEMRNYEKQK